MRERPAVVLNLTIDAMSGKIVTGLHEAGVPSLLLKGPVIARRLYRDGEIRPYADCDLLVRRSDLALAETTVAGLGMRRHKAEERLTPEWEHHNNSWRLDERHFDLELHWTLIHIGADPETLWEVCNRDSNAMRVGGVEVSTPADPQLALILSLHAAQHGVRWTRPQEDLRRAVEVLPPEVWRAAAQCAVELDATRAFAAGLRLISSGAAVAKTLALPDEPSFEVLLTTGRAGEGADQVDRVLRAPGPIAKARVVLRAAFPSPVRMRSKHPAADGQVGLALAYAMHPIRVVRSIVLGLRHWQRARRETDGL
jgi:Uncharacterised nucleotidyltransferase